MKSHKDIKANYNAYCAKLPTYEAVFFPARVHIYMQLALF